GRGRGPRPRPRARPPAVWSGSRSPSARLTVRSAPEPPGGGRLTLGSGRTRPYRVLVPPDAVRSPLARSPLAQSPLAQSPLLRCPPSPARGLVPRSLRGRVLRGLGPAVHPCGGVRPRLVFGENADPTVG